MALNKAVFKTRALTALVFVAVMLAGLFWNIWSFLILITLIHFGCWLEYLKIIEKIYKISFSYNYKAAITSGAFAVALSFYFLKTFIYGLEIWNYLLVTAGICSFILLLAAIIKMKKNILNKASFAALGGVAYISFAIGMLLQIRFGVCEERLNACTFCNGYTVVFFIIFSIWINDTMAYLVGSFIGKTPLSKISPKKTWEGTIGGALLCVTVMGLAANFIPYFKHLAVIHYIAIAAICAVFGTLGDLVESKLKRLANVKDSGSFMPGHGGFLDRFDSLLIAIPFVWLYVQIFIA